MNGSEVSDITELSGTLNKNYWVVILGLLCVVVVIGNVLVIVSVYKERTLHNVTNFFIVSLAVADLLVAGCVMPFSVYVLMNWGMWDMPKVVCDFYIATDVICSTSSIFNLVAISIDRYLAVTSPIKYSQHKNKTTRAYIIIVICWLCSIGIGSPIMLGANPLPTEENGTTMATVNETQDAFGGQEFVCAFYNPDFIIYSSLGSFYIPCFIMIFLYIRIFTTLHSRAKVRKPKSSHHVQTTGNKLFKMGPKEERKKEHRVAFLKNGTCHLIRPSKCQENDLTDERKVCDKNMVVSANTDPPSSPPPPKSNQAHKACGPDTTIYERSKTCQQKASLVKDCGLEVVCSKNKSCSQKKVVTRSLVTEATAKGKTKSKLVPSPIKCSSSASSSQLKDESTLENIIEADANGRLNQSSDANRNRILTFMPTFAKCGYRKKAMAPPTKMPEEMNIRKEKPAARKERKATQTLAIVLAVFLVCWVPFFTCNIMNAICIKFELGWYPGDTAFIVTTWLGYVNSCVNPLIYTIFNPEFRKAFKKILHIQ